MPFKNREQFNNYRRVKILELNARGLNSHGKPLRKNPAPWRLNTKKLKEDELNAYLYE